MKKFRFLLIVLVVVFASTICLTACNSNSKDYEYITEKEKMVIGITIFEPMNYYALDDNGKRTDKLIGFDTELAEAVCKKLGVEPIFQVIEWEMKEIELKSKSIDCIWNGFTITPKRKKELTFSTPYMMNKQAVVIDKKNISKYTTLKSLKDAKLAAESGSAGEDAIKDEKLLKDAKYISLDAQTDVLMELVSGTSDVGVIDYVMALAMVGNGSYKDLIIVEDISLAYEEYGIGFRKGSNMAKKVNEILLELYTDGTIAELAEKYNVTSQILDLTK